MARILVQYETKKLKIKKYRLWCTTVDQWMSDPMDREGIIDFLQHLWGEKHTKREATNRVDRKGYDKEHLDWLNKYFDSQIESMSRLSYRNGKGWKKCK